MKNCRIGIIGCDVMSSKERVKRVFEHQTPDCVPIFEQLIVSKVASEILGRYAYTGGGEFARDMLEAQLRGERDGIVQDYTKDTIELHQKLDLDIVRVSLVPEKKIDKKNLPKKLDENTYLYEDKNDYSIRKFSPDSGEFFTIDSSSQKLGLEAIENQAKDLEKRLTEPIEFDPDTWQQVDEVVKALGKERAICVSVAGIAIPINPGWMQAVILRPELVEMMLDRQLQVALARVEEAVKHGIDFILGGGDLADNKGPVYSPKHFQRFLLPRLKKIVEHCHRLELPYVFRTDGNVWPIAEDLFVGSGADGFGEIQPTAGMGLARLKEQFPHLILWGNLDCGETLVRGTKKEIEKEVKECFEKGKPGGNYIFGSSNSIHWGVPAENFLLMREAAEKYRKY